MKIAEPLIAAVPGEPGTTASAQVEARTRDRVARSILEHGPSTATDLADRLGLTPAAVRRHLEALLGSGLISAREERVRGPRGRGRPAKEFGLTDAGHAAMTTAYDDLAASALRFVAELGGDRAVEAFARERVVELERRYLPIVEAAGADMTARVESLAQALSADGYAASAKKASVGTQLCQGHCPVQHVAAEFPQLCEAETEVFARLLGVTVRRLATLAHGEHVCTTHISDPALIPAVVPPAAAAMVAHDETAALTKKSIRRATS